MSGMVRVGGLEMSEDFCKRLCEAFVARRVNPWGIDPYSIEWHDGLDALIYRPCRDVGRSL